MELAVSKSQDDPIALAIERASNRAVQAEKENALLREQVDMLRAWLADKNETIAILKEQKGGLGEANKLRQEARALDLERIADRDKIIARQQDEINRLRHPGILASIFDKRSVYGAVVGFAACKATNGGTTNPLQQFNSQQLFAKGDAQNLMFQQWEQDRQRKEFLKQFYKP